MLLLDTEIWWMNPALNWSIQASLLKSKCAQSCDGWKFIKYSYCSKTNSNFAILDSSNEYCGIENLLEFEWLSMDRLNLGLDPGSCDLVEMTNVLVDSGSSKAQFSRANLSSFPFYQQRKTWCVQAKKG